MMKFDDVTIAVIGLGYVGLPLAAYFAQKFPVSGFDIDPKRINELKAGVDRTREVTDEEMAAAKHLTFTTSPADLTACNFFVVTVPTPIDAAKRPDLTALEKASETVGRAIKRGGIVIYESTVYPGATEEVCIPIVERVSGLKFNVDFFAGYSPERINPGDHQHRLPSIKKITSGSTPEVADLVDSVYASIITAGTHKASSIRVAEAAKVIENIQRDVNIALVNELAMLFKRMGIETREVLEAAGTKWNFHAYRPGLVGGHCIGVDPYYLTHKAHMIGFHPQVILSGRRTNDSMAEFVAHDIMSLMLKRRIAVAAARVLVMGFTFKEDCPDTRNTKVADLVRDLASFVGEIVIFDPFADPEEARHEYGVEIVNAWPEGTFDGIVLAVRHAPFVEAGQKRLRAMLKPDTGFLYDVKGVFPVTETDARL
ncbi:MAG: nucleotide sugar dehydrogenase [Hyphomicrobiaceae bacterium]|nr:nucleotide sugar dehydrogenase [Hyphomicrobiaceae bacterium]